MSALAKINTVLTDAKMIIRPPVTPEIIEKIEKLPPICQDMIKIAGAFREFARPAFGGDMWMAEPINETWA